MQHIIDEAKGHLGAAIGQSIDSDDQIIMDHVRAAHVLLGIIRPDDYTATMRAALEEIANASIPDQPAASAGDGETWARQHVAKLRQIAWKALGRE